MGVGKNNVFGFLAHLNIRNPKSGIGNSHGEVVDFNAVKLTNGHFNRIFAIFVSFKECNLSGAFTQNHIFQTAQAEIGFGEKVPTTTGEVYQDAIFDTKEKALPGV